MSRGKHLSLEEARKADQLDQFAKEHPSKGDEDAYAMNSWYIKSSRAVAFLGSCLRP